MIIKIFLEIKKKTKGKKEQSNKIKEI